MTSLRGGAPKGAVVPTRRFFWAQLGVAGAFLLLAGRLWQLQVLSGEHYFRKSADNFVKEVTLSATRGQIRDIKGRVLADNRPCYNVYVTPRFFTDEALQKLAHLMRLDDEDVDALKARLSQKRGLDRLRQVLAFEDIDRDQVAVLESRALELPGLAVSAEVHREYPRGQLAGHVLGYMNQITPEELAERRENGYHAGEYVGRAGLEKQWESFLRGQDGTERIMVDAKGQRKIDLEAADLTALLGGPSRIDPVPGHDVITTLDLDLQELTERALRKHKSAAAAVVDVQTGRVLALASWPAPDPNRLGGRLSRGEMEQLMEDPARPLIDKTVRENYFPGSTFKVVPSLAGLKEKMIDPEEWMVCHGAVKFGKRWFHCVEPHGPVNLHRALVESCNVFFYGVGDKLGIDRMARAAEDLGFGAPTGLGLNGEVPGTVPTEAWLKKQGVLQRGEALNTAIGQGSLKVTVMQLAMAYVAIANGGRLWVPQLVERIETPGGKVVQEFPPRLRRQLAATPEQLAFVRTALAGAVNDPKGTSFAARVPGLDVAGKTGTAQVGNKRVHEEEGVETSAHAWFASFAPSKAPRIAVVVLVEHGGFGAKAATPVAMEIYEGYFKTNHPENERSAER
jgi:penicillin-binding protein 2